MKSSVKKLRRRDFIIYILLSLTGFTAVYFLNFPRSCSGYESVFPAAISVVLFVLLFVAYMIILFLSGNGNILYHLLIPAGIVFALLTLNWVMPQISIEKVNGNKVLEAFTSKCKCGDLSTLTLFDNGYYEVKMAETEYVCRYTGLYSLHGDTLFLEKKILAETDSTYFPVYLVNTQDSVLNPVKAGINEPLKGRELTLGRFDLKPANDTKITALQ